ncbi:MAG TPA: IgGFc-binding protein [Candidatus Kapabacteria bacterium]|nr:IgGFc-binding protein [Candidatus Kapabacteria bacterium]
MHRSILIFFALTGALLLASGGARAQQTPSEKMNTPPSYEDSRGKEFWLAFPQNAILEDNHTLTLKLFITSDQDTHGTVSIPGLAEQIPFFLRASDIDTIDIDTVVELRTSELVQQLGVHVVADHDCAIFGLSHRPASTDSYLAYPVKVLGTTYRAVGYYPLQNGPESFTSEFAIVGTEDHTTVTISLTADTRGGHRAGETFSVSLNRGDTYLVQGSPLPGHTSDLTGTLVTATAPISFFIGHTCAQVPPDVSFCDQLLEMEPPIPSWGRQFYVGRFEDKTQYVIRVIASEDKTDVFVNNQLVAKLSAGQFYENNHMVDNSFITASAPVLVAEYAQSSNADSIKVGDPFMLLITPTEQFVNYYRFATPISGEWFHYINLVVPLDAEGSLRVDGRSVPVRYFHKIGISRYGIAQYEIEFGAHAVSCDQPFGLYSYGFGIHGSNYDSYGNDGGQLVKTVPLVKDTTPPGLELISSDASRSLGLIARDDRLFDAGLASIVVIDSDNFASPLDIPVFDIGTPEVPLLFHIRDTGSCGFMSIQLADAAGNISYWVICRTQIGAIWNYTITQGRYNICPSCRQWTAQFITTPSLTVSDVTFNTPKYLTGPGPFDHFSTLLSGGFQGLYIYPIDKSLELAGGIGFSNFTGAAVNTYSTFVPDSILYGDTAGSRLSKLIENYTTEASLGYVTINGGVYYYMVPDEFYIYAGLAAGFLIQNSYIETRDIIFPTTLTDSTGRSTGARSLTVASGSFPSPTAFHIALELSPGFEFKLSQQIALLAGAYMNLPFFNAVTDLDWHLTTFGIRLGLQYRR